MEGVGYEVGTCLDGLRDMGIVPGELVVIGGGRPLRPLGPDQGRHPGDPRPPAALHRGRLPRRGHPRRHRRGLDRRPPRAAARAWNPPDRTFTPDPEAAVIYRSRRQLFDDLYAALVPLYPRLRIE